MKYLGETSGESAASESSGEGDIGFGLAIGHHCVKRTAEPAGGEWERKGKQKRLVFFVVRKKWERERERERWERLNRLL